MKKCFFVVLILLSILGYSFEFVRKAYSSNLYGHIDNKRISFEICLPDNIVVIQPWLNFKNFNPVYFFTTKKADYGIFTGDFDKLPENVKSNLHELASQEDYIYYWTVDSDRRNLFLFKKKGSYTVHIHVYSRYTDTISIGNSNHLTRYMNMLSSIKIIDPKDTEAYKEYYLAKSSRTAEELTNYLLQATKKHHDRALIDLLHLSFVVSNDSKKKSIANQLKDFLMLHMKSGRIDFELGEIIFIYKYIKHEEMVSLLNTYGSIAEKRANSFLHLFSTASKQWKQYSTDPWREFSTEKINELLKKKKQNFRSPKVTNSNYTYPKTVYSKPQQVTTGADEDPFLDLKTTTPKPVNPALVETEAEEDPFLDLKTTMPKPVNPALAEDDLFLPVTPMQQGSSLIHNAYGPGIHQDVFGRPVQYHVPNWPSNEPTQHLNVTPNAYGPGIGMDQFGRPVTTRPAF